MKNMYQQDMPLPYFEGLFLNGLINIGCICAFVLNDLILCLCTCNVNWNFVFKQIANSMFL